MNRLEQQPCAPSGSAHQISNISQRKCSVSGYMMDSSASTKSMVSASVICGRVWMCQPERSCPRFPGDKNGGGEVNGTEFICVMLPEINVMELAHATTGVTKILKRVALEEDMGKLYWEDSYRARSLMRKGIRLRGDHTGYTLLRNGVPEHVDISAQARSNRKLYAETQAQFKEFIEHGFAYERGVFDMITQIQYNSWLLIAMITDEVLMHVFDVEARLLVGNLTVCNTCGGSPPTGKNLQVCSRCKWASYCNATCQAAHWPEHKTVCKKRDS